MLRLITTENAVSSVHLALRNIRAEVHQMREIMQSNGPASDQPNLVERVQPRIRYDDESVKEEDADYGDVIEIHPAFLIVIPTIILIVESALS